MRSPRLSVPLARFPAIYINSMVPDTPQNLYFGGGGDTLVTPLALCILLLASALILLLPRKYAITPFLFGGLLITVRQEVVVFGLHLMIYRLLILAGWIRMLWSMSSTGERPFAGRMSSFDKVFTLWALSDAVIYTILWRNPGALVNRLGFLYTAFGAYFLMRYLIRDREDVIRTIKTLCVVSLVIGIFMTAEHFTDRNAFSSFGGVRLFSEIRNGRVRAQGPFMHPLVAGMFGAMLLPLFVGLWWQGRGHRLAAALGVVGSTAMSMTTGSSTPVVTYLAGVAALCLWPFRRRMRSFRWGLVSALVGLQLVMKVPIWFLPDKLSKVMGGSGEHRSALIDQFIRHFGQWWLIGTRSNAYWGFDMWDCINAYVNAGVEGGLIVFVLFIALFVIAYKRIGMARSLARNTPLHEHLIWALGACLFANTVGFFSELYYDQSVIGWYAFLVMLAVATIWVGDPHEPEPGTEPDCAIAEPVLSGLDPVTTWNET
jgi:hypothetical protein